MIQPGRIEMTEKEVAQLEALLSDLDGEPVSITRRDPNESGPVLVTTVDGHTVELEAD